jgi:hypothetical protein
MTHHRHSIKIGWYEHRTGYPSFVEREEIFCNQVA